MSQAILLDLNKKFELNLTKAAGITQQQIPTMEVRLAIDKSGSMDDEFRNGYVDALVNKFLGVAMSFDDNGSVEVGFFNTSFHEAPEAVPADIGQYLRKSGQSADGGTEFADIIHAFELGRGGVMQQAASAAKGFLGRMFGSKAAEVVPTVSNNPAGCAVPGMRAYVAIVTDGDNYDKAEFEVAMSQTSGEVYYQFICIGNGAPTRYLENVTGRYAHASVIAFANPTRVTDEDFYAAICNEGFVAWMKG